MKSKLFDHFYHNGFDAAKTEDLLKMCLKNEGELVFKSGKNRFILRSFRIDGIDEAEECYHKWVYEDFDHNLNCYLERHCERNCQQKQRWVTSEGVWRTIPKRI